MCRPMLNEVSGSVFAPGWWLVVDRWEPNIRVETATGLKLSGYSFRVRLLLGLELQLWLGLVLP